MKEIFIKIKENLVKKETPGQKLYSRTKYLARMGRYDKAYGSYDTGFSVSPDFEIVATF